VKTRLIPALGAEGAAALHARLVERTLMMAEAAGDVEVELWCAPRPGDPFFRVLGRRPRVSLRRQLGRGLGRRMENAFRRTLPGAGAVVLIGTDCADAVAADLREAFGRLAAGAGAVIGPAADGGYWLLGLRSPCPAVFRGMPWGTAGVLAATRRALTAAGRGWSELPVRHDVDRPEDLAWLEPGLRAEVLVLGTVGPDRAAPLPSKRGG
jgi:hypothetical protein